MCICVCVVAGMNAGGIGMPDNFFWCMWLVMFNKYGYNYCYESICHATAEELCGLFIASCWSDEAYKERKWMGDS